MLWNLIYVPLCMNVSLQVLEKFIKDKKQVLKQISDSHFLKYRSEV